MRWINVRSTGGRSRWASNQVAPRCVATVSGLRSVSTAGATLLTPAQPARNSTNAIEAKKYRSINMTGLPRCMTRELPSIRLPQCVGNWPLLPLQKIILSTDGIRIQVHDRRLNVSDDAHWDHFGAFLWRFSDDGFIIVIVTYWPLLRKAPVTCRNGNDLSATEWLIM